MSDFVTQLQVFRRKGIHNMRYVAGAALRDVMDRAQTMQASSSFRGGAFTVGKIPILKQFLRDSLKSGKNGAGWVMGSDSYETVTATIKLRDVLMFEWTAPYALRIEKGFRGTDSLGRTFNQAGRFYLATNMAKFPAFLAARAAEVRRK